MAAMKKIEEKVVAIGKKLKKLPDNNDELLALLEEAESVLRTVHQDSPESTQVALLPLMQAFIHDKLLKNTNPNIQLQLAVSIHELTTVTAPLQPYPEDLMKECFRLFLIAFKYLHGESEDSYSKPMRILEKMAEVRSILLLMDFEDCEALIGEIFELFFSAIRSNPSPFMIECMESLMNMVVKYNEEFSMDILKPILASVKVDNKDISPASWELGKRIFEKNPTKLQLWLKEADKEMQLNVNDYAEIVFSLLRDSNDAENIVSEEATKTVQKEISDSATRKGYLQLEDNHGDNTLDDTNSQETLDFCEHMMQLKGGTSTSGVEVVNDAQNPQSEAGCTGNNQRKRNTRTHSVISPDEGYHHPLTAVGRYQLTSESNNNGKNDTGLQSKSRKIGKSKVTPGSSQKLLNSVGETSLPKKTLSKRKGKSREDMVIPIDESRDIDAKIVGSSSSKNKRSKISAPAKEKKSKRSSVEYDEELVGSRVEVWWPQDKTFYTGTVHSYDPSTKKHKIVYDDDEVEILDMKKEKWEFFNEPLTQHPEPDFHPSSPEEPSKGSENIFKKEGWFI